MKKFKRQLDKKLKDIQNAVHEKFVVDISVGKANKARKMAQDFANGAHTE